VNANQTKYRVSKLEINCPNTIAPSDIYYERGFFVESNTKDEFERMGIRDNSCWVTIPLKTGCTDCIFRRNRMTGKTLVVPDEMPFYTGK
jgi:hypothetical protein